jgi:ABC-type Fe3+-citrate transport system substrate-binding protein
MYVPQRSARRTRELALVLGAGLLATACGTASQTADVGSASSPSPAAASSKSANVNLSQCGQSTRHITDAGGFVTTIEGVPKRVITIELSFTDDASLVGVSPVGLGDDNDPNLVIPQIKARIGAYTSIGTRESPNLAVISGLKPDLIIADKVGNRKIISQLRAVAPTIALNSQHTTYAQNIDAALTVGAALNQCPKMQQALDRHNAIMANIKAKVPAGEKRTFIFALASAQSVTIFNYAQYTGTVLEQLGLTSVATDPAQFPAGDSSAVSLETLVQLNPEIIFYANSLDAPSSQFNTWQQNSVFQASAAAQSHLIFKVGQKPWSLTRGLTGSEVIAAEAVHDLYGK